MGNRNRDQEAIVKAWVFKKWSHDTDRRGGRTAKTRCHRRNLSMNGNGKVKSACGHKASH